MRLHAIAYIRDADDTAALALLALQSVHPRKRQISDRCQRRLCFGALLMFTLLLAGDWINCDANTS